jgi:acyl carrier protein
MTIEDTIEKITKIIAETMGVGRDSIAPEAKLQEDLMAYSFDLLEIFIEVEEEFGIDIPDEDAEKLQTVRQIADYAHAHSTNT